jgi:hypothetical protein
MKVQTDLKAGNFLQNAQGQADTAVKDVTAFLVDANSKANEALGAVKGGYDTGSKAALAAWAKMQGFWNCAAQV